MKNFVAFLLLLILAPGAYAERKDSLFPVRAFCISAPSVKYVDSMVAFIRHELAPAGINTLLLRVDYNYRYKSRPGLADPNGLTTQDVKKLVAVCRETGIRLIPQINLLGHQSWASSVGTLLRVYPELDETPWIQLPKEYKWPNPDGLYCKSYCPLHPKVHDIVLPMVDEICDVFEADAFHAGMDEVFYIGEDKCPRCGGKNKAELFAGEVKKIRDHLAGKGRTLWIWGDRLLDGVTTGIGIWEASGNNTHPAVDLIPRDVVICDWHYERAEKTPVYFAMKGLQVVICGWNTPAVSKAQVEDMMDFRSSAPSPMKERYLGAMQTVWSSFPGFLEEYRAPANGKGKSQREAFRAMTGAMDAFR